MTKPQSAKSKKLLKDSELRPLFLTLMERGFSQTLIAAEVSRYGPKYTSGEVGEAIKLAMDIGHLAYRWVEPDEDEKKRGEDVCQILDGETKLTAALERLPPLPPDERKLFKEHYRFEPGLRMREEDGRRDRELPRVTLRDSGRPADSGWSEEVKPEEIERCGRAFAPPLRELLKAGSDRKNPKSKDKKGRKWVVGCSPSRHLRALVDRLGEKDLGPSWQFENFIVTGLIGMPVDGFYQLTPGCDQAYRLTSGAISENFAAALGCGGTVRDGSGLSRSPLLGPVPDLIPFSAEHWEKKERYPASAVMTMFRAFPGYFRIMGDEGGPVEPRAGGAAAEEPPDGEVREAGGGADKPLVTRLDVVLAGLGSSASASGDFGWWRRALATQLARVLPGRANMTMESATRAWLSDNVIGDLACCVCPRGSALRHEETRRVLLGVAAHAPGLQLRHLHQTAERSRNARTQQAPPGPKSGQRGQPPKVDPPCGTVALGIGAERADVLIACTRLGLVNHLYLDLQCQAACLRLIDQIAARGGEPGLGEVRLDFGDR